MWIKVLTAVNAVWTFIKNLLGLKGKESSKVSNGVKPVHVVYLDRKARRDLADLMENLDGVAVDHKDINSVMGVHEILWWVRKGRAFGKKIDQSLVHLEAIAKFKAGECNLK